MCLLASTIERQPGQRDPQHDQCRRQYSDDPARHDRQRGDRQHRDHHGEQYRERHDQDGHRLRRYRNARAGQHGTTTSTDGNVQDTGGAMNDDIPRDERGSQPRRAASRFGMALITYWLALVVVTEAIQLTFYDAAAFPYRHWGTVLQWLWSLVGVSCGLAVSVAIALFIVTWRERSPASGSILLAALTIALAFPATSISFSLLLSSEGGRFDAGEFIQQFGAGWWQAYAEFGVEFLVGAILCMWPVYVWLRRESEQEQSGQRKNLSSKLRWLDGLVGSGLLGLGLTILIGSYWALSSYVSTLEASSDSGSRQFAARLEGGLVCIALLRASPLIVGGCLLLMQVRKPSRSPDIVPHN
jgi:hypothetical protein